MIEKIDHVGVVVKNMEEAVKNYRNIGFKVEHEEFLKETNLKVAFLPIGETYIELLEPAVMKKDEVTELDMSKEGIHHIAIKVANIDDEIEQLKKSGIELLPYYQKPRRGARGTRIVFLNPKYTNQGLLELVEKRE
jgi:methylmalonyl-CoA/ethylmalonyl-CoA epimerase